MGIDWTALRGSGRTGRIRKADVLAAARPMTPHPSTSREILVGPIRRTIAARLVESRGTTAPVTLTTTVDATNLVNLRGQFRAADPDGRELPSYTDFVVKVTALALNDHRLLHSRWQGDRIVVPDEAAIGIAVDTEAGLFVPVIRGAAGLGIRQIAARSRDLIRRAREGSLRASEMQGGTFTVTNLGAFGVEAFTPIINPPECAVLGIGRIARQPVIVAGRVVARERLTLSLTFDHRVVDGAPAARFLQALGRLIENPGPWLMP
jgi:pyruvate dehydrogenase E2 component (dihydrolipoamide acetyltransferase)